MGEKGMISSEEKRYSTPNPKVLLALRGSISGAEAAQIQKDAVAREKRLRLLAVHPEQEDEHDRPLRYWEREQARRKRYLQERASGKSGRLQENSAASLK